MSNGIDIWEEGSQDEKEVFDGVEIKGGISYFLYEQSYTGQVEFVNISKGTRDVQVRNLFEEGLDIIISNGLISKDELQLFIDSKVNQYPIKELMKKYNLSKNVVKEIIVRVKQVLEENISYNYYEGGQWYVLF